MKRLALVGLHVEPTSGTSVVILREHRAPFRLVPIAIGDAEAASIAVALGERRPQGPLTHDLMAALVAGLGSRVDRVEITALHDGAFLAELAVVGPGGRRRLDARPSDGIALALRVGAPLYVSETVLDEAEGFLGAGSDDEEIDRAVYEFRRGLEGWDAAALAAALGGSHEGPAGGPPGPVHGDEDVPPTSDPGPRG